MRQDIPIEHQLVQSNHATYQMATLYRPDEYVPNLVFIGVPDVAALQRVQAKLRAHGLPHYAWHEPDNDMGFTAIATAALDDEQRAVLKNYRLYRFNVPSVNPPTRVGAAFNGIGTPDSPVV